MEKKRQQLRELYKKMKEDKSLPLRNGATNLVFGEGSPVAEILFLGEGPGFWEDKKGRPFVGNAGALLNQLLHSIEVPRESVFITNVICYRPPSNRDPLPEEISAFQPYIDEMIKIISPKLIVTLGRFSMAKFLPGARISTVHGKLHKLNWNDRQIVVVPMYHPAAGLRNGEIKRQLVDDFKNIPEILKEKADEEVEVKNEKAKQMSLI